MTTDRRYDTTGQFLTTREAAELLRLAEGSLRNQRAARTGPPFIRLNSRTVRYRRADIERYLEEREVATDDAPPRALATTNRRGAIA